MTRTRTLLFSAAATLLAAVVLEGGSRLLLRVVPAPRAVPLFVFQDVWQHAGDPIHARDRDLFWKPVPGRVRGDVRIDAEGFRGPDFPVAKPGGVRRLVLLGDSVTFGFGVREDETFAGRLRQRLGPSFEVIDCGVTGYTSWQGRRLYETVVRRYLPDAVVVLFGYNDHHSAVWSDREKYRHRYAEAGARVAARTGIFQLMSRVRAIVAPSGLRREPVPRVSLDEYAENLSALDSMIRGDAARAVFLTVPIRPEIPLVDNFVAVRAPQDRDGGILWMRQIDLACEQMGPPWCDAITRHFYEGADSRAFTGVPANCQRAHELAERVPELPIFHYLACLCDREADPARAGRERQAYRRLDRERTAMEAYNDRLRDLGRARRLEVLDLAADLAASAGDTLFLDAVHPDARGHARVADRIERWLREQDLVPPRPRVDR